MKRLFPFLLLLMLLPTPVLSQNKFEVDFGAGLWEAMSVKAKYGKNLKVGICQGFAPGISGIWLTGAELYYSFKRKSTDETVLPKYYLMGGISTLFFSSTYDRFEKTVIYPRFGRIFNFSPKSGLNVDLGPSFIITDDIDGKHTDLFLSASVHLFLKI